MSILQANEITIRIIDKTIIHGLSLSVPEGKVTSIIGPNGCGKSTTLKALARIWPCYKGNVTFNGEDIKKFSHREFAQKLAILTQAPQSPADLTVKDLVEMGRFPHRNWFGRKSMEDDAHVEWALGQTNMLGMQHRLLSTLSGGERQRAWIAMALAQRPKVLLLDEPTTYLDICHQLEVMQLLEKLNRELQLTVVMVMHDINHAVQYSDHIAVIKEGYLVTEGKPQEIVTAQLLKDVFKVEADEFICSNGMPALLPVDLVK
jgi:iron complex transport system ATP-binding protein